MLHSYENSSESPVNLSLTSFNLLIYQQKIKSEGNVLRFSGVS